MIYCLRYIFLCQYIFYVALTVTVGVYFATVKATKVVHSYMYIYIYIYINGHTYLHGTYYSSVVVYCPLAFKAEGVLSLPASVRVSTRLSVRKLYLIRTITRHIFGLESPNLHQTCILGYSAGIENGGHWPWSSRSFRPFWIRNLGNSACPRDNSSQICARITQLAPKMHLGIPSAGFENGGHWPWPSSSFWPFCLRVPGNLACLRDNL